MNRLFEKLFLTRSYFTIALRPRANLDIITEPSFLPAFIRPATADRWSADPILAEEDGKTWLFYEAVQNNHGHIEVAEVLPDASLGRPTVLLKDDCHYSYPFVFQWKGNWYMIPESSAASEIRLYRADSFPTQWALQEILLRERAVDTTVFLWNGKLYLLTFLINGADERVTPQAYALELHNDSTSLTTLSWTEFDGLLVRGAGPLLEKSGALYRPAQRNQLQRYGDGVLLYRLEMTGDSYRELPAGALTTPTGKHGTLYFDGAHTYCRSSRFEAVDLRCRDFDLWKIPRRLLSRLRK